MVALRRLISGGTAFSIGWAVDSDIDTFDQSSPVSCMIAAKYST